MPLLNLRSGTVVFLMDDGDVLVLLNDVGNHLHALVFRPVVDKNDLKTVFVKALSVDAFYTSPDVLFHIIYRYDDA